MTDRRRVLSDRITFVVLAAIAYLPLLRTGPDIIGADTKHYLYLDPDQLMDRAASVWDPSIGLGTVSHQNVGYLWPMGPWYSLFENLGVDDWVAQRLWLGTLLFAAGAGVMFLLRQLGVRGLGASVAALSYMLSPYVLAYAARISAILLPWAGLPWLIALFILALRRGGWRWPAAFALLVTTVGSINASSLIFAAMAVVLWVPFAVWHLQEVDLKTAARAMGRVALLTLLTQVWWIVALLLSSSLGPPVLETTETYQAVSTSSLSTEVTRSLGNWFFYGRDAIGPWVEASVPYTQEGWLMAVSFVLPAIAFGAAAIVRWQHRAYFTTLIVVGAVIAIAAFPFENPSPFGALTKILTDRSSLALALRNAQRAVPLLALGVAALLGSVVNAVGDRIAWGRALTAAPLSLLILANFPALWTGLLVDENLQRPQELPPYLLDAARLLDDGGDGTRVLEIPGTDFAAYRFGNTVDPVLPGLMDRPWVGRESAPQGTEGSINLIGALDRRLQEGTFEPTSLAPVARLLNAGDIVLRGDLQTERYRTPRPSVLAELFSTVPEGLKSPTVFGLGVPNVPSPEVPLVDELALGADPALRDLPAISVYPVAGTAPIVSTATGTNQVILSGDGDGIVDAAAAGLIDGEELVFYSADLSELPASLDGIVFDADAHVIITDTNRRRAERFTTLRENAGYTETADEQPLTDDAADARIPLFGPDADDGDPTYSVTLLDGADGVRATSYGNIVTYIPEERPSLAFDGDPSTAWKTAAFGSPVGERLRVDFSDPKSLSELTLLQPVTGDTNRFITDVAVRFIGDAETEIEVALDDSSRAEPGQRITFPETTVDAVEIEVTADSAGRRSDYSGLSAVGFAEVAIPGVSIQETVRLPTDVVARAGGHSGPLSVVLTRLRANPAEPVRSDPEIAIDRLFALPDTPLGGANYDVVGTIRLADETPDELVDRLIGRPGANERGVTATSSSRLPGSLDARASSALDGDPSTAWVPALGSQVGQFARFEFGRVVTTDFLDLTIIADGFHSIPTRLELTNDTGESQVVEVPPPAAQTARGGTSEVRVPLPASFSGRTIEIAVDAVESKTTIDYFSRALVELPVGIAEFGFSGGEVVPEAPAQMSEECRPGLLTLDGEDLALEITGSTDDATARNPLSFRACDNPVQLVEGDHAVTTTPGAETGLDVDRVVIDRVLLGDPTASDPERDRGPEVGATETSRSSLDVVLRDVDDPFFVVLGESFSESWKAEADADAEVDISSPIRVNGFATAWYVEPTASTGSTIQMSLRWTPQRWATAAQRFSFAAAILCVALLLVGRRTRELEVADPPPALERVPTLVLSWDHPARALELVPTVTVSLIVGLLGALFIDPVMGPLLACLAIVMGLRPAFRALLPIAAAGSIVLGGALTVAFQMWRQYPPGFGWASNYESLHVLGWIGVGLLALNTVLEVVAARSAPPREVRET